MSLQFANGLLHYWTGDHGIVGDGARANIRAAMVHAVRAEITTAERLGAVLTGARPYQLTRLITQTGADNSDERFAEWSAYLTPLILEGASMQPDLFLAELANMLGDAESGHTWARDDYPPRFVNEFHFARPRAQAFLAEQLDAALELFASYAGDNAYALRPKEESAAWLEERRAVPPAGG